MRAHDTLARMRKIKGKLQKIYLKGYIGNKIFALTLNWNGTLALHKT
jgi:hypothetical protein